MATPKQKQEAFKKIQGIFADASVNAGDNGDLNSSGEYQKNGGGNYVYKVLASPSDSFKADNYDLAAEELAAAWGIDTSNTVSLNDFKYNATYILDNYYKKKIDDAGLPDQQNDDYGFEFWNPKYPDNLKPDPEDDDGTLVESITSGDGGFTDTYGDTPSLRDDWHQNVGGPLISSLLEDIKVLSENNFLQQDLNRITATDTLITACSEYLTLLDGFGFTTKIDVGLPPTVLTKAAPIPNDSANFVDKSSNIATHYTIVDNPPLRHAPFHDDLAKNWDSEIFTYFYNDPAGTGQKVDIPAGTGIIVTEFVDSRAGLWVGFVFDNINSDILDDVGRAFYTKVENIRKKVIVSLIL